MVEDHGTGADGQNGGDGGQAQSSHHGAHHTGGGHAARGHRAHGGEHDGADEEGNQQAGNAGLLNETGQIVDSGGRLDDGGQRAAHTGDQQSGQSHCQAPGNPAVQHNLAEVLGILAADVLIALADGCLVEHGQQHGIDHAQTQRHNLIAEDGSVGTDGSILSNRHVYKGAAGNENHGDQNGQEGGEGAGQIVAGDKDILHIVGRGLLNLRHNLGNRLHELLVGPLAQHQPGQQEGNQGDHNAPADDQAQIGAQQNGNGQNAGGGGHHGVGQVQAGLGEGGHLAHGDVLALGEDVGNVGGQDGGDVTEHGDGHDVGGQRGSQLQILAAEQLDEEVGDGLGRAGILNAHSQNGAQHDGDTHAAESAAEAGGNQAQNLRKGEALRLKAAENKTHEQGAGEQCECGVKLDLHNQHHQQGDGDNQKNQKSSCRHL